MKYVFDHDYHIHSQLSSCSRDPEQTTERILQYAKDNNLTSLVLADHYWDDAVPGASGWYQKQPLLISPRHCLCPPPRGLTICSVVRAILTGI